MIDIFLSPSSIYLVEELMEIDLKTYITRNYPLSLPTIKKILLSIIKGLSHIHSKNIIHRDLKPQNILINVDKNDHKVIKEVKIADFGLSRRFAHSFGCQEIYTKNSMTPLYRAPEIILGKENYSKEVDIWSLGCIFGEMVLGKPLFFGESEIEVIKNIMQFFNITKKNYSNFTDFSVDMPEAFFDKEQFKQLGKDGVDLLKQLLNLNPAERIAVDDIMKHPFLDGCSL